MEIEFILRWIHIIGACILLGTGAGIAFFMVMAHRTRNPVLIAHTAGIVVIADYIFTASAVIVQPITGLWLAHLVGWSLTENWLLISIGLYILVGVFWLPVVWIQAKLSKLARQAVADDTALPDQYFKLYRIWFACGVPAFFAVLTIVWLMVARPQFTLF
jgi:uncharacterized membrane protein